MMLIEFFLYLAILILMVPVTVFIVQVFSSIFPVNSFVTDGSIRPSLAVLVPAHNEATGIRTTIKSILEQLISGDRLLVVADNCTDNTADVVRETGAEVVERHNSDLRGKGYALDFGVRSLAKDAPEIVMVVDADCLLREGALNHLAQVCMKTGRPIQALYLMHAPLDAGIKTRVAAFAWLVKNFVRPLGYARFGLPCQLMGTGMAFPWSVIKDANLASGEIVEDLKLGLDLAHSDRAPLFCKDAVVESFFPVSSEGINTQRTRWEHGHMALMFKYAPILIWDALKTGKVNLLALALDLFVPPLALLVLLNLAIMLFALIYFWVKSNLLPLVLSVGLFLALGIAVMTAWVVHGRKVISLSMLLFAPVYACLKIPLYLRFLLDRQINWVRSSREGD